MPGLTRCASCGTPDRRRFAAAEQAADQVRRTPSQDRAGLRACSQPRQTSAAQREEASDATLAGLTVRQINAEIIWRRIRMG